MSEGVNSRGYTGPQRLSTRYMQVGCVTPQDEHKQAEAKLIEKWESDPKSNEEYQRLLKTQFRDWFPSYCAYDWRERPTTGEYNPEGGKRRSKRKTQKKRKAKAKSHKRR